VFHNVLVPKTTIFKLVASLFGIISNDPIGGRTCLLFLTLTFFLRDSVIDVDAHIHERTLTSMNALVVSLGSLYMFSLQ
jgi:hypothetical protein